MGRGFPVLSGPPRSPRHPSTAGGTEATRSAGVLERGPSQSLTRSRGPGAHSPADLGVPGHFQAWDRRRGLCRDQQWHFRPQASRPFGHPGSSLGQLWGLSSVPAGNTLSSVDPSRRGEGREAGAGERQPAGGGQGEPSPSLAELPHHGHPKTTPWGQGLFPPALA